MGNNAVVLNVSMAVIVLSQCCYTKYQYTYWNTI